MPAPRLTRHSERGVTLLCDQRRPGGVTFAFTERTGGVSTGRYASLNLDDREDDPSLVAENRRRALAAMGLEGLEGRLVVPLQVHGTKVLSIADADEGALSHVRREAMHGCDAIACVASGVPVMLLSADCALVVLVAPGGFAIAHSGWRGTLGEVSARALEALCGLCGARADEVRAYIGPHIGRDDYEVGDELRDRFVARFGGQVADGTRLDLGRAIELTLERAGMDPLQVASVEASTASSTERFFSWRAEGPQVGRMGAIACLAGSPVGAHMPERPDRLSDGPLGQDRREA